jgi:hypothetical protein
MDKNKCNKGTKPNIQALTSSGTHLLGIVWYSGMSGCCGVLYQWRCLRVQQPYMHSHICPLAPGSHCCLLLRLMAWHCIPYHSACRLHSPLRHIPYLHEVWAIDLLLLVMDSSCHHASCPGKPVHCTDLFIRPCFRTVCYLQQMSLLCLFYVIFTLRHTTM